jgi:hypothetical protein
MCVAPRAIADHGPTITIYKSINMDDYYHEVYVLFSRAWIIDAATVMKDLPHLKKS